MRVNINNSIQKVFLFLALMFQVVLVSAQVEKQHREEDPTVPPDSVLGSNEVLPGDSVVSVELIEIVDTVAVESDTVPPEVIKAATDAPDPDADLIQARLSNLQRNVALTYNKRVKGFIDYFTIRNRNYLLVMERRKHMYFPIFEEILKKRGMPDEIKYLSVVESGLNPFAVSPVGAAGLWQFMPGTGMEVGLMVNEYVDERLDPYRSTEAACEYLSRLYRSFGDWELALASYNCGPGVVRRGMRRSGRKTFYGIYDFLPGETRSYVPQYTSIAYVMNNFEHYGMSADSLQFPTLVDTIYFDQLVNFHVFCEELNLCYEDFSRMNPAIRTNILPEHIRYPIRIPKDKMVEYWSRRHEINSCASVASDPVEVETTNKLRYQRSSGSSTVHTRTAYRQKIIHTVKKGDVLGKIAGKYGVTSTQIKSWNNLRSNTVRLGQKLVIYRVNYSGAKSGTNAIAKPSVKKTSSGSSSSAKYHFVQPGDSLWSISKQYGGIPVDKIKRLNNLKDNKIKVGQKLQLS